MLFSIETAIDEDEKDVNNREAPSSVEKTSVFQILHVESLMLLIPLRDQQDWDMRICSQFLSLL